jgi:hypothetical protein
VTGDAVARGELAERRRLDPAARLGDRAARVEPAAGRDRDGARRIAPEHRGLPRDGRIGGRYGRPQGARVGVERPLEEGRDKAHDAMFQAIWSTGELGITDKSSGRLKTKLPSIEDTARFYQRVTGVKPEQFVSASKSFGVDLKVRQADSQIIAMQISGTPTIVVNGKYRLNNENLKNSDEIVALTKFLVAKESAPAAAASPAPAKKP